MNFTPLLNQFAGRVGDAKLHTVHAGHGAVGNDQCWKFVGMYCTHLSSPHLMVRRTIVESFRRGANGCVCWAEGQACEDVRIHHETGDAFLGRFLPALLGHRPGRGYLADMGLIACGHPETRAVWYPPIGRVDGTTAKSYTEYFVKHNLDVCPLPFRGDSDGGGGVHEVGYGLIRK